MKLNVLLDLRNDVPVFVSQHERNRQEVVSLAKDLRVDTPAQLEINYS